MDLTVDKEEDNERITAWVGIERRYRRRGLNRSRRESARRIRLQGAC